MPVVPRVIPVLTWHPSKKIWNTVPIKTNGTLYVPMLASKSANFHLMSMTASHHAPAHKKKAAESTPIVKTPATKTVVPVYAMITAPREIPSFAVRQAMTPRCFPMAKQMPTCVTDGTNYKNQHNPFIRSFLDADRL
jgi:hypothetical protein